jgi:hypothetical protein
MPSPATMRDVLDTARFPASRAELLRHATRARATGDQLAMLAALPDRSYVDRRDVTESITDSPTQGRIRGTVSTLLATITGAAAIRTLIRHLAARSLGPVGLAITAVETVVAVRAAIRAAARWRADRRRRRA